MIFAENVDDGARDILRLNRTRKGAGGFSNSVFAFHKTGYVDTKGEYTFFYANLSHDHWINMPIVKSAQLKKDALYPPRDSLEVVVAYSVIAYTIASI